MAYERINWQNEPSEATALNDVNLNKMDSAIYELDGKATATDTAITNLQNGKVDKVTGKGLSELSKLTITPDTVDGNFVASIKMYDAEGEQTSVYLRNGVTVDSALSNSSTNPVQNKVVKSAIDGKSTVAISDTLATGTTLANITIDGTTTAIKGSDIEVDEELSPTSTNPVENKAIYDALNNLLPSKTVSGNPISISDASGFNAKALTVTMNPIQDLHGYDYPWIHDDNESVPYNFRAVQGTVTDVGNRIFDKIVGGTVAWNQLVKNGDFADTTYWSATGYNISASNGILTMEYVNGTISSLLQGNVLGTIQDHKYLVSSKLKYDKAPAQSLFIGSGGYDGVIKSISTYGSWVDYSGIFMRGTGGSDRVSFYPRATANSGWVTGDKIQIKDLFIIDLTQMFGSTIADYIYTLEQSTPGAGVAWFRKLFPNDYYEYNAGELLSVEGLESHVMRDANDNIIGNYPLDDSLTLRGIPKLDASNNLYYDGDIYESDGTVTRKYGIVDLGTLNWTRTNNIGLTTAGAYFSANLNNGIASNLNKICSKYAIDSILGLSNIIAQRGGDVDKFAFCYTASAIGIVDSAYTDADTFKAAMSGVYLVYELTTPTTESADPYTNPQVIDEDGTEEYVGSFIPVGHETDHANICPISGRTEASVTRTAGEDVETKTHQYSETIYGGSDDFVNGGATSTYGFVDLGTLTYTYVSNLQAFYTDGVASTIKRTANDAEIPTWLYSSAYKQSAVNDTILGRNNGRISVASNGRVWLSNFDYTDETALKSALNGITLCYGLATPTTISTSAENITLLKGTNVLSTNADDMELKYSVSLDSLLP